MINGRMASADGPIKTFPFARDPGVAAVPARRPAADARGHGRVFQSGAWRGSHRRGKDGSRGCHGPRTGCRKNRVFQQPASVLGQKFRCSIMSDPMIFTYTDRSAPPPCPPAPQSRCGSDWASRGARHQPSSGRTTGVADRSEQDVRMNDRAKSFVKAGLLFALKLIPRVPNWAALDCSGAPLNASPLHVISKSTKPASRTTDSSSASSRAPAIQPVQRSIRSFADSGTAFWTRMSPTCSRPPGLRTRAISSRAAALSGIRLNTPLEMTTSAQASGTGRDSAGTLFVCDRVRVDGE